MQPATRDKRHAIDRSIQLGSPWLSHIAYRISKNVRPALRRLRFALGWLTVAVVTSGCTLQDWIGTDPGSLQLKDAVKFINNVITFLGAFGSLVVSFIMIAGYQSLMSAGSEEAATRAKDTIKYSAFGMVFLVFGYAIVKLIFASIAYGTDPFK